MFLVQLFKILFIAAFMFMVFNLLMLILRLGRKAAGKKQDQEKEKVGPQFRPEASVRTRGGRQVIELDKDQYKVE